MTARAGIAGARPTARRPPSARNPRSARQALEMSPPLARERRLGAYPDSLRDSEGARHRRRARLDAELLVDALQVLVHRARADFEDRADVAVGLAGGEPAQHVLLARRELPGLRGRPTGAA